MNMAPIGILFFIFTVICVRAKEVLFTVQCKTESVGQYGQQSLLECWVQAANGATDAGIKAISWRKEGLEGPLMFFKQGKVNTNPDYQLAEPPLNKKHTNVSLLIANTTMENAGAYTCMVITNSGDAVGDINLKVTAKYSKPTIRSDPKEITVKRDGVLTCESHGGYPKGEIRWIVEHDTEWTEVSKMEEKLDKRGLFHLSSKLPLLRGSIFSKYTCAVYSASGSREAEAIFVVEDIPSLGTQGREKEFDAASKIIAPVVVIGSLIVGLLVALLFLRRRRQNARRQSKAAILGGHLRSDPGEEEGLDTIDNSFQM
nr:PREDICTED: CD276 antigen homolog isoform X1 [Paralichthys olivaceus]